jgi:hypothetical protein
MKALEYRIYDGDGNLIDDWDILPDRLDTLKIPTNGSLHIKHGDGWLNFRTSEWLLADHTPEPKTWGV